MTNTYQRPSGAYSGDANLNNRTKYQNDASAEPKVPISSSKMDGDFNYIIDALNEVTEAKGSRASIDERMNVSLNADGTLKLSVAGALDDWLVHDVTSLARVSDNSISMSGNQTGIYTAGRRVKLTVSGADIVASVASSSYSASTTTVVLVGLVNSAGASAIVSTTPSSVSYSPLTSGKMGNTQRVFDELKVRAAAGVLRLNDTGGSGKEFGLRSNGGVLEIVENTGTEESPTYTVRASIGSSGLTIADDAVTLAKLAHGTAGKVIGFNGSGEPAEVDSIPAASVTASSLAADVLSGQTAITSLEDTDVFTVGDTTNSYAPRKISVANVKAGLAPSASTDLAGIVELATTTEAETATDTDRAVTPAGVKSYVDNRLETLGGIGALVFAGYAITPSEVNYGDTESGSNLYPMAGAGGRESSALSGTWKCLGYIPISGTNGNRGTLWIRIS